MAEGYEHIPYRTKLYDGNPTNGGSYTTTENINKYQDLIFRASDSNSNTFTALHFSENVQSDLYVVGTDSGHTLSVIFTSNTDFIVRNKGNAITRLIIYGDTK